MSRVRTLKRPKCNRCGTCALSPDLETAFCLACGWAARNDILPSDLVAAAFVRHSPASKGDPLAAMGRRHKTEASLARRRKVQLDEAPPPRTLGERVDRFAALRHTHPVEEEPRAALRPPPPTREEWEAGVAAFNAMPPQSVVAGDVALEVFGLRQFLPTLRGSELARVADGKEQWSYKGEHYRFAGYRAGSPVVVYANRYALLATETIADEPVWAAFDVTHKGPTPTPREVAALFVPAH